MTVTLIALLLLATQLPLSRADDDEEEGHGPDVLPARDSLYREECGECHFAYPPGLLPAASWRIIMGELGNHFGDNAELDSATTASLLKYLGDNAADTQATRRSRQIMRALSGDRPPLRITEVPFMRHEHREITRWLQRHRPDLRLSQCDQCHQRAEHGSFRESEINVPGLGRWDD